MRFGIKTLVKALSLIFIVALSIQTALAQPTAVVPNAIIYPGQTLTYDMVREVEVINPNLRPGYARIISEVDGMVTKRTLLPGRIIPVAALREAFIVERGKVVPLIYTAESMILRAQAVALQNGMMGEVIRVRNVDSGITIAGIVMQDGSVKAMAQ